MRTKLILLRQEAIGMLAIGMLAIVKRVVSDAEVRPVGNLITGQTHHYGLGEAAPPKGVSPMSNCRSFPHERLHQDRESS
ncbi:hypothetical protein BJP34_35050 [Moorena producens PAL-8-15-08-1]|uniref:Uncharacterized protein n=1 Tax=Moorena producens PAL-8-15-08-1 TaxID=1458985 RepID=A0A1D8U2E3_9CYAN|nr:hypothetical protein BJP34_35050 [Moorena producens PAL-8-15-08-1]